MQPEFPPDPLSISDICISPFQMDFLVHDSGPEDKNRFIVLGKPDTMEQIQGAHLFGDGTFDVAPKVVP